MAEMKKSYETVFILSTKLGDDGIVSMIQKFKDLIGANGTIDTVDEWGKRRLAYPINKEEEGYYTLISFESEPSFTAELDRIYNITEGVLRSLIVRKEPAKKKAPKKETPVETSEEAPKEASPDAPKEPPKEAPKETPQEAPKETPKDAPQETPLETPKEAPKEEKKEE